MKIDENVIYISSGFQSRPIAKDTIDRHYLDGTLQLVAANDNQTKKSAREKAIEKVEHLSAEDQAIVKLRISYCQPLRLEKFPKSIITRQRVIDEISKEISDPAPPSASALYDWFTRYEGLGFHPLALLATHKNKGNRDSRVEPEVKETIINRLKKDYLIFTRPTMRTFYRKVKSDLPLYRDSSQSGFESLFLKVEDLTEEIEIDVMIDRPIDLEEASTMSGSAPTVLYLLSKNDAFREGKDVYTPNHKTISALALKLFHINHILLNSICSGYRCCAKDVAAQLSTDGILPKSSYESRHGPVFVYDKRVISTENIHNIISELDRRTNPRADKNSYDCKHMNCLGYIEA